MPDVMLVANGGGKSNRRLRPFERETAAATGCLVDIPGSLGTNPTLKINAFGYGLLGSRREFFCMPASPMQK